VGAVSVINLLIAKLRERDAIGLAHYGGPLLPFNGRRALQEAQEEALDLAVYIEQEMTERAMLDARIAQLEAELTRRAIPLPMHTAGTITEDPSNL